jgi:hypothetical protein
MIVIINTIIIHHKQQWEYSIIIQIISLLLILQHFI